MNVVEMGGVTGILGDFSGTWHHVFNTIEDCTAYSHKAAWQGVADQYKEKIRKKMSLKGKETPHVQFRLGIQSKIKINTPQNLHKIYRIQKPLLLNLKSIEYQETNPYGPAFITLEQEPVTYGSVLIETLLHHPELAKRKDQLLVNKQDKVGKSVNITTQSRKVIHQSWKNEILNKEDIQRLSNDIKQFIGITEFDTMEGNKNLILALEECGKQWRIWNKSKPLKKQINEGIRMLQELIVKVLEQPGIQKENRDLGDRTLKLLERNSKVPFSQLCNALDYELGGRTVFTGSNRNSILWNNLARMLSSGLIVITGGYVKEQFLISSVRWVGEESDSLNCNLMVYDESRSRFLRGFMSKQRNQILLETLKSRSRSGLLVLEEFINQCGKLTQSMKETVHSLKERFTGTGITPPDGLGTQVELKPLDEFDFIPRGKEKTHESRVISSCVAINRHFVKLSNSQPLPGVIAEAIEAGVRFVIWDIADYFSTLPMEFETAKYLVLTSQLGDFYPLTANQGWVNSPAAAGPSGWAMRQNLDRIKIPEWKLEVWVENKKMEIGSPEHDAEAIPITNLDDHLICLKKTDRLTWKGKELHSEATKGNELLSILGMLEQIFINCSLVGNSGPLKLRADKMNLGSPYVTYLNENVGQGLRAINLQLYKKLAKKARSYSTFKEVGSILATINYFGKYIKGCAHKLAKIREIIHPFAKTSKIEWANFGVLETLLDEVIKDVNNAPALYLLGKVRKQEDIERLGLWHDSSKRALGYILAVKIKWNNEFIWIPVKFGSSILTLTQGNCPIYLNEALSLIFALRETKSHVRSLFSYPLEVFGDSSILFNWLQKNPAERTNNEKLESWCGELAELLAQVKTTDVEFRFKKSEQNLADSQSRGMGSIGIESIPKKLKRAQQIPNESKLATAGKDVCGLPQLNLKERKSIGKNNTINIMSVDDSKYKTKGVGIMELLANRYPPQPAPWEKLEDDREKELKELLGKATKQDMEVNINETKALLDNIEDKDKELIFHKGSSSKVVNLMNQGEPIKPARDSEGNEDDSPALELVNKKWVMKLRKEHFCLLSQVTRQWGFTVENTSGIKCLRNAVTLIVGPVRNIIGSWGKEALGLLNKSEIENDRSFEFGSFYELDEGSVVMTMSMNAFNEEQMTKQLKLVKLEVLTALYQGRIGARGTVQSIQLLITAGSCHFSEHLKSMQILKQQRIRRPELSWLETRFKWTLLEPEARLMVDPFCKLIVKTRSGSERHLKYSLEESKENQLRQLEKLSINLIGKHLGELEIEPLGCGVQWRRNFNLLTSTFPELVFKERNDSRMNIMKRDEAPLPLRRSQRHRKTPAWQKDFVMGEIKDSEIDAVHEINTVKDSGTIEDNEVWNQESPGKLVKDWIEDKETNLAINPKLKVMERNEELEQNKKQFWEKELGPSNQWKFQNNDKLDSWQDFQDIMVEEDGKVEVSEEEVKNFVGEENQLNRENIKTTVEKMRAEEQGDIEEELFDKDDELESLIRVETSAPLYGHDLNFIRLHQKFDFKDRYEEAQELKEKGGVGKETDMIGLTDKGFFLDEERILNKLAYDDKEEEYISFVVLPRVMEELIITDLHEEYHEGNFCISHRLRKLGWWCEGMTDKVRQARKICLICAQFDIQQLSSPPKRKELSTIAILKHPKCGQVVSIDGLYLDKGEGGRGHKEIMVACCTNCNMVTAKVIENCDENDYLKFLRKVYRDLGYFHTIITDNVGYQSSAKVIQNIRKHNRNVADLNFKILKNSGIDIDLAINIMESGVGIPDQPNLEPTEGEAVEQEAWEDIWKEGDPQLQSDIHLDEGKVKNVLSYIFNRKHLIPPLHRGLVYSPITPKNSRGNPSERSIKKVLRRLLRENQAEGDTAKLESLVDEVVDQQNSAPQKPFNGLSPYDIHLSETRIRTAGQEVNQAGFYPDRTVTIPTRNIVNQSNEKCKIDHMVQKHHNRITDRISVEDSPNCYNIQSGDMVFRRLPSRQTPKFKAHYAIGPYFVCGRRMIKGVGIGCYALNLITNKYINIPQDHLFPFFLMDFLRELSPRERKIHINNLPTLNQHAQIKLLLKDEKSWLSPNLASTVIGHKAMISQFCLLAAETLSGIDQQTLEDHHPVEKLLWLDIEEWKEVGLAELITMNKKQPQQEEIPEDEEDEIQKKCRFQLEDDEGTDEDS